MAHEVRTPPLPPATVTAGQAAARPTVMDRVDAGLEGLWHLLTSMRVAMILMIILAALCVIGSLLIQVPTGLDSDPLSKQQWLDTVRPKYGGWTNVLDALGLFNIFNSIVFRVLVAALTISLIACTAHRIPGAWRTATRPRVDVGPGFFEHAPQRESIVVHTTSAEALAAVQGVLRKHHYRTTAQDDGTIHLYADRNRFVAFASLAGHVSLILILLGAIIGSSFGFKNQYFVVPEGSTVLTGTEPGLSLKLVDFTDSYYASTGEPEDYVSQVVLLKDGQQVAAQEIRVNEPLTYDGATYYQRAFGPAVAVTIKDASGKTLYNEGMPLDGTTTDGSDRSAGSLAIPGTTDMINVFATTGTSDTVIQPGQVQIALYKTGTTAASDVKVFDQGKAQQLGNYTVTFDRELKYTVLSINEDPGQYLVWLGALLLFAGFTLVFLLPQRRVWARISQRGTMAVLSVASLGRRDAALGTDFDDLLTDIRAALQAPAQV
jgi:cytochrome c biogenesis protein